MYLGAVPDKNGFKEKTTDSPGGRNLGTAKGSGDGGQKVIEVQGDIVGEINEEKGKIEWKIRQKATKEAMLWASECVLLNPFPFTHPNSIMVLGREHEDD